MVDVAAHLPTRWAAIRAHASQASPYDDLPPELQHEFLAIDRLRLVRGTDLLAPLTVPQHRNARQILERASVGRDDRPTGCSRRRGDQQVVRPALATP